MKPHETRLLLVLLGLFFIAANVVGGVKLLEKKKAIARERDRLEALETDLESLLESRARYREFGEWIATHQPVFENRESMEKEMLAAADGAEAFGITITGKDLLEIEELDQAIQSGIWLRAEGSLEGLLQWLHELQQPEKFRVIRKLRLIPGGEVPSTLQCEFLLLRWYRPADSPAP